MQYASDMLDDLGIGVEVKQLTKEAETSKRMILPPSRHAPDQIIEPKRATRGGVTDYPPFGCTGIKRKPDPRTRALFC